MTLLRILGIDRYTAKFKEWIGNKFIAKNNIKTINNESLVGKGNIEISGGSSATPDWNALEGKEGFIKNRTHYYNEKLQYRGEIEASINHIATYVLSPYEYIDKDIYGYRSPDKIKFTGGGTSFTLDFIKEPIPGYNDEEGIQETVLKRFTIDSNNDIEVRYYYNGNPTYYEGVIIELDLIATDSGYQEYITFTTEDYYVDLKQIDDIYIPGTVVKTTPQSLSNTEKNQVRENILAQEKLVSGVNVATINGKSILGRKDIRINETIDLSNIITSRPSSTTEPIIVEIKGGSDYNYIYSLDFHKIFIKTVNEITLNRGASECNEIHFSYVGRTFPTYDYDHVIVYYNAPNYLLVCEAFSGQLNGVYNCIQKVKFTLNKIN